MATDTIGFVIGAVLGLAAMLAALAKASTTTDAIGSGVDLLMIGLLLVGLGIGGGLAFWAQNHIVQGTTASFIICAIIMFFWIWPASMVLVFGCCVAYFVLYFTVCVLASVVVPFYRLFRPDRRDAQRTGGPR